MIRVRLVLLALAVFLLAGPSLLSGQTPPPWVPDKQFSADAVATTKDGMNIVAKANVDTGKIRVEGNLGGMDRTLIVRPDQQKVYIVMTAQKMAMQLPLDAHRASQYMAINPGPDATFELVGPDTVAGSPAIKYKMTAGKNGKVYDWWLNATTKVPVKLAAEDGTFSVVFSNYKAGPQDPTLFEPPADFSVMQMPSGGAPGGQ